MNFHGEKRSNDTHESKTDPESRLYRKGHNHAAHLSYVGNVLMEKRNGLVVDLRIDTANGFAERHGALALLDEHLQNFSGATLGADAGYDTSDFIAALRERSVTPHVAQARDSRGRSAVGCSPREKLSHRPPFDSARLRRATLRATGSGKARSPTAC